MTMFHICLAYLIAAEQARLRSIHCTHACMDVTWTANGLAICRIFNLIVYNIIGSKNNNVREKNSGHGCK